MSLGDWGFAISIVFWTTYVIDETYIRPRRERKRFTEYRDDMMRELVRQMKEDNLIIFVNDNGRIVHGPEVDQ